MRVTRSPESAYARVEDRSVPAIGNTQGHRYCYFELSSKSRRLKRWGGDTSYHAQEGVSGSAETIVLACSTIGLDLIEKTIPQAEYGGNWMVTYTYVPIPTIVDPQILEVCES